MNPWMKRTESSASAAVRHMSLRAPVLAEVTASVVLPSVTAAMSVALVLGSGEGGIASIGSSGRVVKAGLLQAAQGPKYKAAFATAYDAGLRVSEVVALKVGGIVSERMLL